MVANSEGVEISHLVGMTNKSLLDIICKQSITGVEFEPKKKKKKKNSEISSVLFSSKKTANCRIIVNTHGNSSHKDM